MTPTPHELPAPSELPVFARKDGVPGVDRMWDSQWVNVVNSPEVLGAETVEDAVNAAVRLTEQVMAKNAREALARAGAEAVAWYYGFADTGEAGPVTFGGNPGAEAIEWAERHGHTLHYLYTSPPAAAGVPDGLGYTDDEVTDAGLIREILRGRRWLSNRDTSKFDAELAKYPPEDVARVAYSDALKVASAQFAKHFEESYRATGLPYIQAPAPVIGMLSAPQPNEAAQDDPPEPVSHPSQSWCDEYAEWHARNVK